MKSLFIILALSTSHIVMASAVDTYKCYSYQVNGQKNTDEIMLISVSESFSQGNILNESWDDHFIGGELNANYKSKGPIKYKKYGQNLVIEESLLNGGRQLNDGIFGGFARAEGEAEGGFFQYKFICKK